MTKTWFDLITVDVIEPRASAAWFHSRRGFVTLEDEDDGRWVVVGDHSGARRIGFQRSTKAEIEARYPSRVTVAPDVDEQDGDAAVVHVDDVDASAEFWHHVCGLRNRDGSLSTDDGRHVISLRPNPDGLTEATVHFDLTCEQADFDIESARIDNLGAARVGAPRAEPWGAIQTFVAPDGIVFCLNAYG